MMANTVGHLHCRIACLETNLTNERNRVTQLEQTIIQLSTLLTQQLSISGSVRQTSTALITAIEQEHSESDRDTTSSTAITNQAPNLIDVEINEKPPKLDLEFKGLRTAHDGPIKDSTSKSYEDQPERLPSFREVFGLVKKPTETSLADSQPASSQPQVRATSEAVLRNVSASVAKFSLSKSYRSNTPPYQSQSSNSTQDSDQFRKPLSVFHGIRYKPKVEDSFLNRSRVMIFNLPLDVAITDVISKVRGGLIISYQVLDTKFAYNSLAIMVRFSSYIEAMRCVEHAESSQIVLNGKTASVQLIPTPSYPLSPEIYKNTFELGHTRCLLIYQFKQRVPVYIRERYANDQHIEYQVKNGCGDWFVRFTSVQRASALWSELEALRITKPGEFCFVADPCDVENSSNEPKMWKDVKVKAIDMGTLKWEE